MLEPFQVLLGIFDVLPELLQSRLEILDLLAHNLQPIGRQVIRHDHAMPIEDQSPGRWQRLDADAITVGQRRKVFVLDDLQYIQPAQHNTKHEHDEKRGENQASPDQSVFEVVVF